MVQVERNNVYIHIDANNGSEKLLTYLITYLITYLLNYLLTYLLHEAEPFFRS